MERTYANQQEAMEVAKEAMWLAYQASAPVGLGFMHARNELTKDDIVKATFDENVGYADYCAGRMMKTSLRVRANVLSCNDTPRGDYQSWASKYSTYAALIDAAEKNVLNGALDMTLQQAKEE